MKRRSKSFPSTPDATVEASAFVLEAAQDFGVADSIQESLLLVIGEAVANATEHGNSLDAEQQVRVECVLSDNKLQLYVEDGGSGVPAERLEHAALPSDPLQTSGRGLYIMKSLSDAIWLEDSGRRLCVMWQLANDSNS